MEVLRIADVDRADRVERTFDLGVELPSDGTQVVVELLGGAGAEDRRGDAVACQVPVQGNLSRRLAELFGTSTDSVGDREAALGHTAGHAGRRVFGSGAGARPRSF